MLRTLFGHVKTFAAQMKASTAFFAAGAVFTILLGSYILASNPGELVPVFFTLVLDVVGFYCLKFMIALLQDEDDFTPWAWRGVYAGIVLLALTFLYACYGEYRYYHQISIDKARTKINL